MEEQQLQKAIRLLQEALGSESTDYSQFASSRIDLAIEILKKLLVIKGTN